MKCLFSIFMIFTMDRFVMDWLGVDKFVVILIFVMDNHLKSLIV